MGGVVSWIMECLADSLIKPEDVGARDTPVFSHNGFNIEEDSMHNASIGISIIDTIIRGEGILNLEEGARLSARKIADDRGKEILDKFVYTAFARKGWMVPNQYWTPGVLSPMAIMGKYYMNYGKEFYPPRELGRINAERFKKELILDNLGICRFHRNWAEEMMPDIIDSLYGLKNKYLEKTAQTAAWINSRNSSILWESERCADFIYTFLKRNHEIEGNKDESLLNSLKSFEKDKEEAALNWWYETHKGAAESLREV